MAKSSTKRKYRTKSKADPALMDQLHQGVEAAVDYIQQWQRDRLLDLALKSKPGQTPICVPINKDNFLIGSHALTRRNRNWLVIHAFDQREILFSSRTSALIYLLCLQKRYGKLADDILRQDSLVLKFSSEVDFFSHNLSRARNRKNWDRVDHLVNLQSNAKFKLLDAKKQLEKSIVLAKYFKIWE